MGALADSLKNLIDSGVTGDALVTAVSALEEILYLTKPKSVGAIRQERYRRNKASQNVTSVTQENKQLKNNEITASRVTPQEKATIYTLSSLLPSKEEKERKKAEKATRFTLEVLPPLWGLYCSGKYPHLNPEDIFDEFRDYWISVPGKKGFKLDWEATWRTWLRRQKPIQNSYGELEDRPTWY